MSLLVAQEFECVRREVDEHENAVWPQHAGRLGDRCCRPIGVVQHLMNHDRVKGGIRQRQLVHVAEPHLRVVEPRLFEIDACDRQHLAGLVDAQRVLDPRRENFEHSAGTGSDIEQIVRV